MLNRSVLMKFTALLLVVGILFAGCSSSTLIQSNPSGAKVYMNEEFMGVTPYSHTDTKIVGSTTFLRLEKDGYEPINTHITRNEEVDVGAIIGGIFFFVPYLWVMKYKPVHNYELRPLEADSSDFGLMTDIIQGDSSVCGNKEYISGVLK